MKTHTLSMLIILATLRLIPDAVASPSLPTLKEAPCRNALEAKIARAQQVVGNFRTGHVVVGRVMLDGPEDPRYVKAQMEILEGGYFAGEVRSLDAPISFRMHQYAPLDVNLKSFSGEIIDIGTVHMKKLPSRDLADLKGRIELAGTKDASAASVSFTVSSGKANTPHNGTEPRRLWPTPIEAEVHANGAVSASGFSRINYYCTVSAPGYVKQSFPVSFEPDRRTVDLGTIRLERPARIALSYVVADKPPFDLSLMQQTVLSGGDRWNSTSDNYGWDLEFKQKGEDLFFNYSYSPCSMLDLGKGELKDLIKKANVADPKKNPRNQEVMDGHVYVVDQGHFKRWILFKVNIQENRN